MSLYFANLSSISSEIDSLQQTLPLRIEQVELDALALPAIVDKWILSSALQKLIRRGKAETATGVALRLHQVDPDYLPRRLPIIAVEDIGVGDLAVCHDVLTACSSSRWWRTDPSRTISFLVGSMARAVKSRAACDALCLAEAHRAAPPMMGALLAAKPSQLVGVAVDPGRPRLERMNALRLLGGVTVRRGPRYVTVSRCDLQALDQVADELNLRPLMRWVMARNKKTGNLAALLPIVAEAMAEPVVREGGDFPHSLDAVGGVPLCGVDMFSECGRGALREFFLSSTKFKDFSARHIHGSSPMRLFNMALFHAESSILDRYLSSPALDLLTRDVEHEEMGHLGMRDPDHKTELRALIAADARRLAEIRSRRVALAIGSGGAQVGADGELNHA